RGDVRLASEHAPLQARRRHDDVLGDMRANRLVIARGPRLVDGGDDVTNDADVLHQAQTLRRSLSPELRLVIEDARGDLQHSDERISLSPGVEADFLRLLEIVAKQIVELAAQPGVEDAEHV